MPPTSALVPAGAAPCAVARSVPLSVFIASEDAGLAVSVTWNAATVPAGFGSAAETEPTPGTVVSFVRYDASSSAVSGEPLSDFRYTCVGCVAPAGSPRSSSFCHTVDSEVELVEPEDRSKVGLKLNAAMASATITIPEIAAKRAGRRPIEAPIAAKRAARGSAFQAF